MDVYEQLMEVGHMIYPGDEAAAERFARGRADSTAEAREQWTGGRPATGTIPSGLAPDIERSVALETAAFGITRETAQARVMQLVGERLPDQAAARQTLLAHQGRLSGRR